MAAARTTNADGQVSTITAKVMLTGPSGSGIMGGVGQTQTSCTLLEAPELHTCCQPCWCWPVRSLSRIDRSCSSGWSDDRPMSGWVRSELDVLEATAAGSTMRERVRVTCGETLCLSSENVLSRSDRKKTHPERWSRIWVNQPAHGQGPTASSVTTTAATRRSMTESDDTIPYRPPVGEIVSRFVDTTVTGRTMVFASGPGGMMTVLRGGCRLQLCQEGVEEPRQLCCRVEMRRQDGEIAGNICKSRHTHTYIDQPPQLILGAMYVMCLVASFCLATQYLGPWLILFGQVTAPPSPSPL